MYNRRVQLRREFVLLIGMLLVGMVGCMGLPEASSDWNTVYNGARMRYQRQQFMQAKGLGQRAVDLAMEQYGAGDMKVVESFIVMGMASYAMEAWPEAAHAFERALAQRGIEASGNENIQIDAVNLLGLCYTEMGRYQDAIRAHKRQLALVERKYGAESTEMAMSLNNLGFVYTQAGQLSHAEPLLVRQIEVLEVTGNKAGRDYSDAHYNMGLLRYKQGRFSDAAAKFKKSGDLLDRIHGVGEIEVAAYRLQAGMMWLKAGRGGDAKIQLENVVRVYDRHVAKLGLQVAIGKAALAAACEKVGDVERAKQLRGEVRGMYRSAFGAEDAVIAEMLGGRVKELRSLNRWVEADFLKAYSARFKAGQWVQ
ncbi:Tetratricopeptide repeat protein [Poriferisphaera corsica]|uniref:Tetratricopeptide repeat protein n=1 Tax=Poriferisphaera corsica TaxID=2528020 RepID=A0A517YRU2_9BACT|nr:tetratricopeptide repeat protein [Poriferisphaera corsica]QDU32931.1 Tetratricopeptide repeat protein [Poriferisphaera corsica]